MNGTEVMAQATEQRVGGGSTLLLFLAPMIILAIISLIVLITTYRNHKNKVQAGKCKPYNLCFKILCLLGGAINFVIVGLMIKWSFTVGEAILFFAVLLLPGMLTQCLYFLPYLIANGKGHQQETAIFILNLFAGWTILAWVIALIWACTVSKVKIEAITSIPDELKKYKDLLDAEVITQEEFEAEKKKLLNP